jgi:phospholipid/cholesterol/gamma-HCH transport system substrate-binding protein
VVTTLRYHQRWGSEQDEREQEALAEYSLRAATHLLDSDPIYTRHEVRGRVGARRGKHKVEAGFLAGRIDGNAPIRKDTQAGLEFQGLTGVAAISFTGGTEDAPPPPTGPDGIPELTADPEGTMGVQQKIRIALSNVDKAIAENEDAIKDTLRNFETFTASLYGNGERINSIIAAADSGIDAVDSGMAKTETLLKGLGSDKYGGELLPTIVSLRELIESFDKKSGTLIAETRKMLGEVRESVNNADRKFGGTGGRR